MDSIISKHDCKGLIFRGYNSVFKKASGNFEQRQGFKLLKRKSCSGCARCGGLLDLANDWLCDYTDSLHEKPIQDGGLYRLYYDGDDFFFVEEKKEGKK
jgi:hypothetical protein